MSEYDEIRAKRYIICSMLAIGWILIYDIIMFFSYVKDMVDVMFICENYLFGESFSIFYLITLFLINLDLSKADNPIKYKENTDWFYEKYEEKDKKNNQ